MYKRAVKGALRVINDNESLCKLRDLYKSDGLATSHIYNYLSSAIRWKKADPHTNHCMILAPEDVWEKGTFLGYFYHELVLFTLDEKGESLYNAITQAQIDWKKPLVISAIPAKHFAMVSTALEKVQFKVGEYNEHCNIFTVPIDLAANFDIQCPEDVYIAPLAAKHADIVNKHWSVSYTGSLLYFQSLLKLNSSYGIFLKSNHQPVSWVIEDSMFLAIGHTLEDHRKNGYHNAITSYLAKEMAKNGRTPSAAVCVGNMTPERFLLGRGFQKQEQSYYLFNKEMVRIMPNISLHNTKAAKPVI